MIKETNSEVKEYEDIEGKNETKEVVEKLELEIVEQSENKKELDKRQIAKTKQQAEEEIERIEKTVEKEKQEKEKKLIPTILDILKFVSPGTSLRNSINNIVRANHGALVVVNSPELIGLFEGGFRVNCRFTEQRLTELCKMDGAVIISEDLKKILHANTMLIPSTGIVTNETGTRHKVAERTAKQANTFIVAISEKKKQITLYYRDKKYVLKDSDEILRRAAETLHILEKQRDIFDDLINNFNILEMTNLVVVRDVCMLLQRIEIILRIEKIIKRYLVELGNDGLIVKMRLKELTRDIEDMEKLILREYTHSSQKGQKGLSQILSHLSFEGLLDIDSISRLLFELSPEEQISPCGYRILEKTSLTKDERRKMINQFGNLSAMLNAQASELKEILKNEKRIEAFQKEIDSIKEQVLVGRKI